MNHAKPFIDENLDPYYCTFLTEAMQTEVKYYESYVQYMDSHSRMFQ